MKIQLIRKLAGTLNGIDLTSHAVGEVLDLPSSDARVLVAEGWAVPVAEGDGTRGETSSSSSSN